MADYSEYLFTEKDEINCSFFYRVGACKNGDRCTKKHYRPQYSRTVLLRNFYRNPLSKLQSADKYINLEKVQEEFDELYEEIFCELSEQYGKIQELHMCENLIEHLAGNVYVKFRHEKDAEMCCLELNNRWFNGHPIYAELCPVIEFHKAICNRKCKRGDFHCNFLHVRQVSRDLRYKLFINPQFIIRQRSGSSSSSEDSRDLARFLLNDAASDNSESYVRHPQNRFLDRYRSRPIARSRSSSSSTSRSRNLSRSMSALRTYNLLGSSSSSCSSYSRSRSRKRSRSSRSSSSRSDSSRSRYSESSSDWSQSQSRTRSRSVSTSASFSTSTKRLRSESFSSSSESVSSVKTNNNSLMSRQSGISKTSKYSGSLKNSEKSVKSKNSKSSRRSLRKSSSKSSDCSAINIGSCLSEHRDLDSCLENLLPDKRLKHNDPISTQPIEAIPKCESDENLHYEYISLSKFIKKGSGGLQIEPASPNADSNSTASDCSGRLYIANLDDDYENF